MALAAFAAIGATSVQAQTVQFGPGGPQVDLRSERQRERDFQREEVRRDRESDRRAERRALRDDDVTTGSTGRCRTVTTRERDDYGRMVTREMRECR